MKRLSPAGWIKLAALGGLAMALAPVQILVAGVRRGRPSQRLTRLFYRSFCHIVGARVRVHGTPPPPGRSVLVVSNHVSWLDIPVIGAQHPVSFVSKAEVAQWPGIGPLARMQRTVFIDRTRRSETAAVSAQMGARISKGETLVLFAEGTTSDGNRVLPFRSALFGAVREAIGMDAEAELFVQPLTVVYLGRHGLPGGRQGRANLAWSGDAALAPHAAHVLSGGPIDIALTWGAPIRVGPGQSRKTITAMAEASVRQTFLATIHGR